VQRAVDRAYAATQQVAAERDAKTRFLTSASHDLGQPLQAAQLFFDDVMDARTQPEREAAGRRVTWALESAQELLRRMLDHLKLEAGAVTPKLRAVPVGTLIARMAEMHEPSARLAGVDIVALPSRLAARADPDLVDRALGNLVANAIRHAKARRLLIGARRRAGRVRLWVIDDGVGIAEADAPRLFDDYVQGAHGDEVRGGFGLGLASARRMAALMGGAVGLDRAWRRGSAFWLELPAADAKLPESLGRRWARMKTCLICDDHEMMREALAGAVAKCAPGVAITQVADFPSAWAAAQASRPELIISDLVMPGAAPVEGVRRLDRGGARRAGAGRHRQRGRRGAGGAAAPGRRGLRAQGHQERRDPRGDRPGDGGRTLHAAAPDRAGDLRPGRGRRARRPRGSPSARWRC
jgi:hypothetical protein